MVVSLLVAVSGSASGQDWNFTHDASGNTTARSAAASSLPQIVGHPQPQIVALGDAAAFSVVLADAAGATYQWRFNSADIGGATGDSLVIPSVAAGNAGIYSVVVTNGSGSVTSADAALFLDSDIDGLPDSWEQANFGNLFHAPGVDDDHDGVSNLDEFRDGTNPNSNASLRPRLTITTDAGGAVIVSPVKIGYTLGEVVTLTATPFAPNIFRGWAGDLNTLTNPTTITMSANRRVHARFFSPQVPDGIISWWKAENNPLDTIGVNHGALINGASFTAGKVGQAFSLNGTNQSVEIPDSPSLHPASITLEAWIKSNGGSGFRTIFHKPLGTGTGDSFKLNLNNGANLIAGIGDQDGLVNILATPYPSTPGEWHHVAFTFDDLTKIQTLYLDGVLVTAKFVNRAIGYDSQPILLGRETENGTPSNFFLGAIDEATIYQRALTAEEIFLIYRADTASKPTADPIFTSPARLPDGIVATSYNYPVTAALGMDPRSFSLASGALPPGLTLSPGGMISGTPTAGGSYAFLLRVTDATGRKREQTFNLKVLMPAAPAGLVAWWRAESNAQDSAGTNHGTLRNGATFAPGQAGQGFLFDGVDDYMDAPDAPALRPASVTMETWISFPTAPTGTQVIMSKPRANSPLDSYVMWWSSNFLQCRFGSAAAATPALMAPLSPVVGQWYHVACSFDDTTKQLSLYLDGALVANSYANISIFYDAASFVLGCDLDNGAPQLFFNGRIDEAAVYNRALSAAEVRGLFEAGAVGKSLTGPFSINLGDFAINQPITTSLLYPAGVAPVSFSLLAGEPPPGISLLTSGAFSGTSPTSGVFSFTARATGANSTFIDLIPSVRIFRPADRPAGLISWYRAENNLQDSVGTNHGTNFGATTYRAGKAGSAFNLNGSSGVIIADTPSLRPASITYEGWVNFASTQASVIANKLAGTFNESWFIYSQNNLLVGGYATSSTDAKAISAPFTPLLGRWYHVAYSYDAGTLQQRLYLDGVRVAIGAVSAPIFYDSGPTLLGYYIANGSPSFFHQGGIDEAAIYNRALADSEIAAIYAASVAGKALPGFGDFEDLDGDQLVNLLEQGINTNPAMVNAGPSPATMTDASGGVHAVISLVRDPRKTDVTITVESSGDLLSWVSIATSTAGQPFTGIATIVGEVAGPAPRTVTIIDPYYGSVGFLRVRVSR
jgi:hypothetical protein